MIVSIDSKIIPFDKKFQALCKKPFYGHPYGCPNYGFKKGCPPNQPLINEVIDFDKTIYVIYTEFPVGEFAERMRQEHPDWNAHPRQWYNPRRWQSAVRKEHRKELYSLLKEREGLIGDTCPEAKGINVSQLMKNLGINLRWEWPPKHDYTKKEFLNNKVYLVSIAGYPSVKK